MLAVVIPGGPESIVMVRALLAIAVPVPVSATVAGLPAAFVAIESDAVVLAVVVGVNVMEIEQFALAANELPHVVVLAYAAASVPVRVIELIESVALPVLVSVTAWAPLVVLTV